MTAPVLSRTGAAAEVAPSEAPTAAAFSADSRRLHPAAKPSAPAPRPTLRLVPKPRPRRARRRLLAALGVVVAGTVLFGLAGIHVLLTEGQFRLGRLQGQADDAQAQYVRLRLQVAELESPQRIVAEAQERLGMITPSALTYLTPTTPATTSHPTNAAKHTTSTTTRARTTSKTDATQAWAAAKPALASHP